MTRLAFRAAAILGLIAIAFIGQQASVSEASSGAPPTLGTLLTDPRDTKQLKGRDQIARSEQTGMMCDFPRLNLTVVKIKPRRCTSLRSYQAFAEGFYYTNLRWPYWGKNKAHFRGITRGFKLPYLNWKVWGKVYRPRPDQCGGSRLVFTRILSKTKRGKIVRRLDPCVGVN